MDDGFLVNQAEMENAIASLAGQVEELRGRLQALDAHGLTFLQFGSLAQHPVVYSTAVPTTADMGADGQIRVVHTGGLEYLYFRSAGVIKRVQGT